MISPLSPLIPVNSITPVAAYIALRDVWQALLPRLERCGPGHRSGARLEGHRFPDPEQLRTDEENGKIPSIILSPMIIEDGRRLLISNLDLRQAHRRDRGRGYR